MESFELVGRWSWLVFILIICANAAILRVRANKEIALNPELEDGYRTIIKGLLLWGNIPWVAMGIGIIMGGVPSIFHYFNIRNENPYVLAFWGSIFFIWMMGTYWILFKNGAEMLITHPGLFNYDFKNPLWVKIFWVICAAGSIAGFAVMYNSAFHIPK